MEFLLALGALLEEISRRSLGKFERRGGLLKYLSRKEAESQHRVHEYIIFHMSFDEGNRLGQVFQQSKSLVLPLEDQKAWTKFRGSSTRWCSACQRDYKLS